MIENCIIMNVKNSVLCSFLLLQMGGLFGYSQNAKSLLWEVSGNDLTEPSYVYGTFHSQDKRVYQFSDSVLITFGKCKYFGMELLIDSSINPLTMMRYFYMDSLIVRDLYSKKEYDKIVKYFEKELGMPFYLFEKMYPIMISTMVTATKLGADSAQALDLYFHYLAKKQLKGCFGLETIEEQVNAFKSMPISKQKEALLDAVTKPQKNSKLLKELIRYYVDNDIDKLYSFSKNEKGNDEFENELITKRNGVMVSRMKEYIRNGSSFIAVGALHLPGKEGIINLLRAEGYVVRAVQSKK